MTNLYNLLGVDAKADAAALKTAYRKLAMDLHPDRTGNDPAKSQRFKEVSAAYTILSDPQKRSEYDRLEKPGLGGAPGKGESIFGSMFDDLVNRVQNEGISTANIDSLIADLFQTAKHVQKTVPEKAKAAAKSPASLLDLVEQTLDAKIAWDKSRQR